MTITDGARFHSQLCPKGSGSEFFFKQEKMSARRYSGCYLEGSTPADAVSPGLEVREMPEP